MSHLVNPSGFRPGKSFLWSQNSLGAFNNKQIALDAKINQGLGLEGVANNLLRRANYWTVRSSSRYDTMTGVTKLQLLYYPLVAPLLRKKRFPTYCAPRGLLNRPSSYTPAFKRVISKVWSAKSRAFTDRFVRAKKRIKMNLVVRKAMFRGTRLFRGFKRKLRRHSGLEVHSMKRSRKYLHNKLINYRIKKNRWMRWRQSKKRLSSRLLSKLLSKRTGTRVQVRATNVFTYLLKKNKIMTFSRAQKHIWNKRYHYHKRRFSSYYDMVNSLWILCHVPNSEALVLRMIRYGLAKMHRRKIRPKNFFYFVNDIVQNMPEIKQNFNAIRVMITGKLRGGTSRTKSFSTGFGRVPRQSLDQNIRYEFGNVRSKYGSFGVKLLTWRKSEHERLTDRKVKWSLYRSKRALRLRTRAEIQAKKGISTRKKRSLANRRHVANRRSLLRLPLAKYNTVKRAIKVRDSARSAKIFLGSLLLVDSRLRALKSKHPLSLSTANRLKSITARSAKLVDRVEDIFKTRKEELRDLERIFYTPLNIYQLRHPLNKRFARLKRIVRSQDSLQLLKRRPKARPLSYSHLGPIKLKPGQRYAEVAVRGMGVDYTGPILPRDLELKPITYANDFMTRRKIKTLPRVVTKAYMSKLLKYYLEDKSNPKTPRVELVRLSEVRKDAESRYAKGTSLKVTSIICTK